MDPSSKIVEDNEPNDVITTWDHWDFSQEADLYESDLDFDEIAMHYIGEAEVEPSDPRPRPSTDVEDDRCHSKKRQKVVECTATDLESASQTVEEKGLYAQRIWLKYLLSVNRKITIALNSGDLDEVKAIIDVICLDDCVFVTAAGVELLGRHEVFEFFKSLIESHPDALFAILKPSRLKNGTICTSVKFSGTRINEDYSSTYLRSSTGEICYQGEATEADRINALGLLPKFDRIVYKYLFIDKQTLKICRWKIVIEEAKVSGIDLAEDSGTC